jgi:hypothetical protein
VPTSAGIREIPASSLRCICFRASNRSSVRRRRVLWNATGGSPSPCQGSAVTGRASTPQGDFVLFGPPRHVRRTHAGLLCEIRECAKFVDVLVVEPISVDGGTRLNPRRA